MLERKSFDLHSGIIFGLDDDHLRPEIPIVNLSYDHFSETKSVKSSRKCWVSKGKTFAY